MKSMLRAVSMIYIIFSVICLIGGISMLIGGNIADAAGESTGAVSIIGIVLAFTGSAAGFATGMLGLSGSKGQKAPMIAAIVLAIIFAVAGILMSISFPSIFTIFTFILAVMMIISGFFMMRKILGPLPQI